MSAQIRAPFSAEQVTGLNRYQEARFFHPFTCGKRDEHPENEGVLIATEAGWVCPAAGCDYTQGWAWMFMADERVIAAYEEAIVGVTSARYAMEKLREIGGP